MSLLLATWLVRVFLAYAVLGVLFAVPFVFRGVNRIDPNAAGSTWGFRVLIFPGVVALWPLLLRRWMNGTKAHPPEKSPHRLAAREGGRP